MTTYVADQGFHNDTPPVHMGGDFAEHEKTYHGVLHLVKWVIVHLALLIVGLYFIIFGNAGPFGTFLIMASAVALAYGVISTPRVAEEQGMKAMSHEDSEGYPLTRA
ncbi:MAG TPA: aa3-type cytochrome c oxidase subunit IV [Devosiaceae bacterium]|jgi:hypothetical protein